MNEQQTISPRQRLKELLSIQERQRTDEQWDEINELEIALASANRVDAPDPGNRRSSPASADPSKPGGGSEGKKRTFKKFHKRPPKEKNP